MGEAGRDGWADGSRRESLTSQLRRGGELFIVIAPISVRTRGKWGEATEPQVQYRTLDQHGGLIEGSGVAGGGSRGG